jgi:hypothetical protein
MDSEQSLQQDPERGVSPWIWFVAMGLVAAFLIYFRPILTRKAARLDVYVCSDCGVKQRVLRRWRRDWLIHNSTNFEATAVSTAFQKRSAPCDHRWSLAYFDIHGSRMSGHGKPGSLTLMLVDDQRLGTELQNIAGTNQSFARKIWSDLCVASFSTNAASQYVATWTLSDPREPLLQWYFEQILPRSADH